MTSHEDEIKAEVKEILDKMVVKDAPRPRGLIMPNEPGCLHDWEPYCLELPNGGWPIYLSKCSKCHVLGRPPS